MSNQNKKLVPRDDRITINQEFASLEQFVAEYATNISRSGVFIRTKSPLPLGTKVNLKFTVILDDMETIEGTGEVVRLQRNPIGMGVSFLSLSPRSQDLIAKLATKRKVGERQRKSPPLPPGSKLPSPKK